MQYTICACLVVSVVASLGILFEDDLVERLAGACVFNTGLGASWAGSVGLDWPPLEQRDRRQATDRTPVAIAPWEVAHTPGRPLRSGRRGVGGLLLLASDGSGCWPQVGRAQSGASNQRVRAERAEQHQQKPHFVDFQASGSELAGSVARSLAAARPPPIEQTKKRQSRASRNRHPMNAHFLSTPTSVGLRARRPRDTAVQKFGAQPTRAGIAARRSASTPRRP